MNTISRFLITLILVALIPVAVKCQDDDGYGYKLSTTISPPPDDPVPFAPDQPIVYDSGPDAVARQNNTFIDIKNRFAQRYAQVAQIDAQLTANTPTALQVQYPRFSHYYRMAHTYVDEINQEKALFESVTNRGPNQQNVYYQTDISEGNASYKRLDADINNYQRTEAIINSLNTTATNLPATLNSCRAASAQRQEAIQSLYNRYEQLRQQITAQDFATDENYYAVNIGILAANVPAQLVKNYLFNNAEYLVKLGAAGEEYLEVVTDGKIRSTIEEGLIKNCIEDGKPLDSDVLTKITMDLAFEHMKDKLFSFDFNDTYKTLKQFNEIQETHESLVKQKQEFLDQIDQQLFRLKTIIQLDQDVTKTSCDAAISFLTTTDEAPLVIPYREVPASSQNATDANPLLSLLPVNTYPNSTSTVANIGQVSLFITASAQEAVTCQTNIDLVKQTHPEYLAAMQPAYLDALRNFQTAIDQNRLIQTKSYLPQGMNDLTLDPSYLQDYQIMVSSYQNGLAAMDRIRIVQQLFRKGYDDLQDFVQLLKNRDDYYKKAINKAGNVSTNVNNANTPSTFQPRAFAEADKRVAKLIDDYLAYTGNDPYTQIIKIVASTDDALQTAPVPDPSALAKIIAAKLARAGAYPPQMIGDLLFNLQFASYKKLISDNPPSDISLTPAGKLQLAKNNFAAAQAQTKTLIRLIEQSIPIYLQTPPDKL